MTVIRPKAIPGPTGVASDLLDAQCREHCIVEALGFLEIRDGNGDMVEHGGGTFLRR